jgi:hypothetical protein
VKVTLKLTVQQLVMVYLVTGNEEDREVILTAIQQTREFNQRTKIQGGNKHGR